MFSGFQSKRFFHGRLGSLKTLLRPVDTELDENTAVLYCQQHSTRARYQQRLGEEELIFCQPFLQGLHQSNVAEHISCLCADHMTTFKMGVRK